MQNIVIYLVGFPGTGKYTIAKEIAALENFIVVDNHLINNPVFSLVALDGKTKLPERVWENTEKIWAAVLDTMIHVSPPNYNFVLTSALFEDNEDDHETYNKVESMTKARNSLFVPVRLLCLAEELQRRIVSGDRQARLKEISAEVALDYSQNKEVLKISHDHLFVLDVSNLTPKQAAENILAHVKSLTG